MDEITNSRSMYGTSFTGLLAGIENGEGNYIPNLASHELLIGMGSHQEHHNNVGTDNVYVDDFGIDHEDFDDEDEEGNEVEDPAMVMAREAACITPSWNTTGEPDPKWLNLWQTWVATDPFPYQNDFAKGQVFNSFEDLESKITKWSALRGKEFMVKKHASDWYVVHCVEVERGCTWRLSAHKIDVFSDTWRISKYTSPHVPCCVRDVMRIDNRNITQKFICREIIPILRVEKTLTPKAIMEMIHLQYKVAVSYRRAWGAKQKAIASIFGDWEESYAILPRFLAAVKERNPGTVVQWSTERSNDGSGQVFRRVFWSFGPCIEGFKYCRPLLTIDGTHLYGKYKGCLLIAMGVDANDQIFPLAFAVVESENGSSWPWFMEILGREVTQRTGLCVISDRHKGILKAFRDLPRWKEPNAWHRFCVRHVVSNFHDTFKTKLLKDLAGSAANQHEEVEFERRIEAIGLNNPDARKYLEDIGRDKWSLSHDNGHRYGVMTTNMSECFNGVMKESRQLPILALVQSTWFKLNAYFVERLATAIGRRAEGHPFSENIEKKIEEIMEKSRSARVTSFSIGRNVYQVDVPHIEEYGDRVSYVVDLPRRACSCQRWRNLKMACPHVLAVCRHRGFDYKTFIDPFFTIDAHVSAYHVSFYPVGGIVDWPVIEGSTLLPDSTMLRGRGRRETSRHPNEMDRSAVPGKKRCSQCGQQGHNKRSCASQASSSAQ